MSNFKTIRDWNELIDGLMLNGRSTAIAVFDLNGHVLDANQPMSYFLDIDPGKCPRNSFVNPEFSFFSENPNLGKIFDGIQTIGNRLNMSYSLATKVFRKENSILVFAEADIQQLFHENNNMSRLNQEVNNLQRQLIREKMNLQETLKELKETQQLLVHSEKMNAMGKLVAGVAHEINNPVSFVYSNLFSLEKYIGEIFTSYSELEELINLQANEELTGTAISIRKKNDLDYILEDVSDLTKESKTGLERVRTIVEDLRNFSRLDEAELKRIDLIANIFSTLTIARFELSTRNIRYQLHAPERLMTECFPGQLNQALLNVIINAAQAIGKDGNITISVYEEVPNVVIKIQDDGCGIPEAIKDRIFDPFFTTKPVGSGTGLGLSITYKIITDLHKGTIAVDSAEGEGSCFILTIPCRAD
jgi:signal transduction histidine kinase